MYVGMYVYSYIHAHTCIDLDCLPYLTCLASVRQHSMHANSRGSYYCSFYAVAIKSRGLFVPPLHSNGRSPLPPLLSSPLHTIGGPTSLSEIRVGQPARYIRVAGKGMSQVCEEGSWPSGLRRGGFDDTIENEIELLNTQKVIDSHRYVYTYAHTR